jgi:hypothetical protein
MSNASLNSNENIIYQRNIHNKKQSPALSLCKTPEYRLNNEVLNGNISWKNVVEEILNASDFSLSDLASDIGMDISVLENIMRGNAITGLSFKGGAKLLRIQFNY